MKKDKMVTITVKNGAEFSIEVPESKLKELFGKNYGKVQLSTLKAGETFLTGNHEWVVLEQSGDTTAVIHKDVLKGYRRFDVKSNNWLTSELRKWLNNEFAKEIAEEVGENNLVEHTPDLSTDDGSDKYEYNGEKDKVSLLSCNSYRKYHKYIPKTDSWYWALTPLSTEVYMSYVRFVYGYGSLEQQWLLQL